MASIHVVGVGLQIRQLLPTSCWHTIGSRSAHRSWLDRHTIGSRLACLGLVGSTSTRSALSSCAHVRRRQPLANRTADVTPNRTDQRTSRSSTIQRAVRPRSGVRKGQRPECDPVANLHTPALVCMTCTSDAQVPGVGQSTVWGVKRGCRPLTSPTRPVVVCPPTARRAGFDTPCMPESQRAFVRSSWSSPPTAYDATGDATAVRWLVLRGISVGCDAVRRRGAQATV